MHWVELTPIWIVGLVMAAGLVLARELGFQAGRRLRPHEEDDDSNGYLVSSALALLALMLAFTFGAAETRFRTRQGLVLQEANAIGTAYLRSQLLDEPWRDDLGRRLLRYSELRQSWAETNLDPARLAAANRETAAQQKGIWSTVDGFVRAHPVSTLNGPLVEPINEMIDLTSSRQAAQSFRIPVTVMRVLALYAFAAAAVMGYGSAAARRHGVVSTSVLVLLTLAYGLVLDLDRPNSGSILVSQAAIQRTIDSIRSSEAAKAATAKPSAGAPREGGEGPLPP